MAQMTNNGSNGQKRLKWPRMVQSGSAVNSCLPNMNGLTGSILLYVLKRSLFVCYNLPAECTGGRLTSNFRFLCGRGNWIVCWISGGQTQLYAAEQRTEAGRYFATLSPLVFCTVVSLLKQCTECSIAAHHSALQCTVAALPQCSS